MHHSEKKYRLLIVEDDSDLAELTRDFFQQFEFDCFVESNGQRAVQTILNDQPDLVLLDLMLPDMDGLEICRHVKDKFNGSIVMLTARVDTIDQVLGLEIGADDYVSKPVEPRLLLAKARAVLRRKVNTQPTASQVQTFNKVEIHAHRREVFKDGVEVQLTMPEYELMALLAENRGKVISRDEIFLALRGVEYDGQNRHVDILISSLRAKLEDDQGTPTLIKTVRSKGYLFAG